MLEKFRVLSVPEFWSVSSLGQWLSTRDDTVLQGHFAMSGDIFWILKLQECY